MKRIIINDMRVSYFAHEKASFIVQLNFHGLTEMWLLPFYYRQAITETDSLICIWRIKYK